LIILYVSCSAAASSVVIIPERVYVVLHGVVDGVVSYDSRQGDRRGTDMDLNDFTYDGSVSDGQLAGGLGQLTDYEIGDTNFRLDSQNLGRKGYEWVGWRNDTGVASTSTSRNINIVFRFDQVLYNALYMGARRLFSGCGQIRGLGTKVPQRGPEMEPWWESGG